MGKKSRSKAKIKIDKKRIKEILKKQKVLKQKNKEILDKKRDKMLSSKNMFVNLQKKIIKKKNSEIKKKRFIEQSKVIKKEKIIIKPKINLFKVKKFENKNKEEKEEFIDKTINKNLKIITDIKEDFNHENPFKNNQDFILENSSSDESNLSEDERDIHLKSQISKYDPIFEEINKYNSKFFKNLEINKILMQKKINEKKNTKKIKKILEKNNNLKKSQEKNLKKKITELNKDNIKIEKKLPIAEREFEIVEKIYQNPITIICGETGSGKSTQLPKYLLEAGFSRNGIIGITQPRRIASISLAYRVAEENNIEIGSGVGYHVRFEKSRYSSSNKIKFMTDGILLNEMMSDFLLSKYSVIIIDEAHERKLATDILLGLLSRVIKIRANKCLEQFKSAKKKEDITIFPLRMVIMSATLKIKDFLENKRLFPLTPPLVNIQVRTFPVNLYYNKVTPENYFEEMIVKVKKIHLNLPKGGILVFLTGKEEVNNFCKELHEEMKYIKKIESPNEEDLLNGKIDVENIKIIKDDEEKSESILTEEFEFLENSLKNKEEKKLNYFVTSTYQIFPLYSKLPVEQQQKIFKANPEKRLIVVSTNVAETSLTIKGLKYLVDSGKEKNKYIDLKTGVTKYSIDFITKSSAEQRKGRVGRTGIGYCYRIYSPAIYKKMKKHKKPEILRLPLNYSILQLAKIGMENIQDFPFPSLPNPEIIKNGIIKLVDMGLLTRKKENLKKIQITKLGETLSFIPLQPQFSIILLKLKKENLLHLGILLVGILSSEEIFNFGNLNLSKEEKFKYFQQYDKFLNSSSDILTILNIIGTFFIELDKKFFNNFQNIKKTQIKKKIFDFATKMNLNLKVFKEFLNFIIQVVIIFKFLLNETDYKNLLEKLQKFININKKEERILIKIISESFSNNISKKRVVVVDDNRTKLRFETLDFREAKFFKNSFVKKNNMFYIYQTILEIDGKYFLKNITKIQDYTILINLDKKRIKNIYLEKRLIFDNNYETFYDKKNDKILSYYKYYFGPFKWETPVFLYDCEFDIENKYALFLVSFLKGQIFLKTKHIRQFYKFKINKISENFIKTDPTFVKFIKKLKEFNIFNKKSFLHFHNKLIFKKLFIEFFERKKQNKISSIYEKLLNN